MWLQFFSQNFHFAVNLFGGLVALGVAWLYFDAWTNKHSKKELIKWLGFGVLGFSFLLHSTVIEQTVLGGSPLGDFSGNLADAAKMIAYILIAIGLIMDPLQPIPENKGLSVDLPQTEPSKAPAIFGSIGSLSRWAMPFASVVITFLYWRRATKGLERHLRPVYKAFGLIALSDIVSLSDMFRDTDNPVLYTWLSAFGWVWWLEHVFLALGVALLGRWVWGYLTERFFSQLFMIFTTMVMSIFLVVGVGFTTLLIDNVQRDTLTKLDTAANVLSYALDAKKSETKAVAEQLSGSSEIVQAILTKDQSKLITLTDNILSAKQLSSLVITNVSGQVMLRAEDPARWGDSISGNPLIKRSLFGIPSSTVAVRDDPGVPTVQVLSASTVFDDSNTTIGTVLAGLDLDAGFVDRIQESTGLQSSIYGGEFLAATTLVAPDGETKPTGAKLSSSKVKSVVLGSGNDFQGAVEIQNRQMLAAFLPVKDVDNQVVGALMVAEPQSSVLVLAGRSIETTFLLAAGLLLVSFVPTFFASRNIARQLE